MDPAGETYNAFKPSPHDAKFELVKEIRNDVWLAVRKGDFRGERYLARPLAAYNGPRRGQDKEQLGSEGYNQRSWETLLNKGDLGEDVAEILSHDNLVSLVGRIDLQPLNQTQTEDSSPDNTKTYLVWDYCDGGNLSSIFEKHKVTHGPNFYLPESLCWHVLRSLTRAVAYLHDGFRLDQHPGNVHDATTEFILQKSTDADWMPILHRAIEPSRIYFQQPRGIETYGKCKLGDFSHATVTAHIVRKPGQGPALTDHRRQGVAIDHCRGHEGLQSIVHNQFYAPWDNFPEDQRLYELGLELWSIAAVVMTMMTGRRPTFSCEKNNASHITRCRLAGCEVIGARQRGCDCMIGGCDHMPDDDCTHVYVGKWELCSDPRCKEPIINLDSYMARSNYSVMLRKEVMKMLDFDPKGQKHIASSFKTYVSIEGAYQDWREQTEEGIDYRDLEDDMMRRWKLMEAKAQAEGNK